MNQPSASSGPGARAPYSFIVRIEARTGEPRFCGTGFLLSPLHVATCAHVADHALLRAKRKATGHSWPLLVRCGSELRRGSVVAVCDPDGVLILLESPVSEKPVRLLVDMRGGHEDALERHRAFIVGFTESVPNTLVESPVKRVVNSLGHVATRQLCEIQIEGGRRDGMSGSPVLVEAVDGPVCLGVVCAGGEDAANSRFVLASGLRDSLDRCGADYPTPLKAGDVFGPATATSRADEPISSRANPQRTSTGFWSIVSGRRRLFIAIMVSLIVGVVVASRSASISMAMLTAIFYGSLYTVSVLLESAFGANFREAVPAAYGTFCLMLLTSVSALAVDERMVEAGNPAALPMSLAVFILSASLQWLLVRSALPAVAVVPSRFPSHTAQTAHLKNTLYFLLIVVIFWVPPAHCIAVLRRNIRAGNTSIVREMLAHTVIVSSDVVCLNRTWLWGLFLLLALLAIPMGAWLTNNLTPHPKTNTYTNLLYLRAVLYFLLILACLIWFSVSLGSLPV